MELDELRCLVVEPERAWQALGHVSYGPTEAEKKSMVFRRSLYIVKDFKAEDVLTAYKVRAIRPGYGLPPKYLEVAPGTAVKRDVGVGTPLVWYILA